MPYQLPETNKMELESQLRNYLNFYGNGIDWGIDIAPAVGGGRANAFSTVIWNREDAGSAQEALQNRKAFESELQPGPNGSIIRAGWNMYRGDTSALTKTTGLANFGMGMPISTNTGVTQSPEPQIGGVESLAKRIAFSAGIIRDDPQAQFMDTFGEIERIGYGGVIPPNIVNVSPQESGSRLERLSYSRNVTVSQEVKQSNSIQQKQAAQIATDQLQQRTDLGLSQGAWIEDAEKLGPTMWMRPGYAGMTASGEADVFLPGSAMGGKNRAPALQRPEAIIGYIQKGRYERAPIAPSSALNATVAQSSVRGGEFSGGQVGIRGTAILPLHGFPATSGASLFVPPAGMVTDKRSMGVGFQSTASTPLPNLEGITQLFHIEDYAGESGNPAQRLVPNIRMRTGLQGRVVAPTASLKVADVYTGKDSAGNPIWKPLSVPMGARKAAVENTYLYLPREWQNPDAPGTPRPQFQKYYDLLQQSGINYAFRSNYGEAEVVAGLVQQDVWSEKTGTKTGSEPYGGRPLTFYNRTNSGMQAKYPDLPTANYIGTAKSMPAMMPQMLGDMPLSQSLGFLQNLYPQMEKLDQGKFVSEGEVNLTALSRQLTNPSTGKQFRSYPAFMQDVANRAFQIDPTTGQPISLETQLPGGSTVREQQLAQARQWGMGRLEGWIPFGQKAAWTVNNAKIIDLPGSPQSSSQKNVFMQEAVASLMQSDPSMTQETAVKMANDKIAWEMNYVTTSGQVMKGKPGKGGAEAVYTGYVRDEAVQMPYMIVPTQEYSGGANAIGMELQQAVSNISPDLAQYYGFVPKEGKSQFGVETPSDFNPQTTDPSRYALERAQIARITNEWGTPLPMGATQIGSAGAISAQDLSQKISELQFNAGETGDESGIGVIKGLQNYINGKVGNEMGSNLMSFSGIGVNMISPSDFLANEKLGFGFQGQGTEAVLQPRTVSNRVGKYLQTLTTLAGQQVSAETHPEMAQIFGFGLHEYANRLLNKYAPPGKADLNSPVMGVAASTRYKVSGIVPNGRMFLSNNEVRRLSAIAGIRNEKDIKRYGAALSNSLAVVARDPIPAVGSLASPGSVVPLRVLTGQSKGIGKFIQNRLRESGQQDTGAYVGEGLLTWQGDADLDPLRYLPTTIPFRRLDNNQWDFAKFEPGAGAKEEQVKAYQDWYDQVLKMATPESQRSAFNAVLGGLGEEGRQGFDPLRKALQQSIIGEKTIFDKRVVENYLKFPEEIARSETSFSEERTQSYNVFKRSALAAGTSLGMNLENATKLEDLGMVNFQKAIDLDPVQMHFTRMLNTAGFYEQNKEIRFGYMNRAGKWNMLYNPGRSTDQTRDTFSYQIAQSFLGQTDIPNEGLGRWLTAAPQAWTEKELSKAYQEGNAESFMATRSAESNTAYQGRLEQVTGSIGQIRERMGKGENYWDILDPLVQQGLIGERSPAIHAMMAAGLTRADKNRGVEGKVGMDTLQQRLPRMRFGDQEKTLEQQYYETEPYRMMLDFTKASSGTDPLGQKVEPIYENPARFESLMQQYWKIGQGRNPIVQSMWMNFGQRLGATNPAQGGGSWSVDIGGKPVTMETWGEAGQSYKTMMGLLKQTQARTASGSRAALEGGWLLDDEQVNKAREDEAARLGLSGGGPFIPPPGAGGAMPPQPPTPPGPPAPPNSPMPPSGGNGGNGGGGNIDWNQFFSLSNQSFSDKVNQTLPKIKEMFPGLFQAGSQYKTRVLSAPAVNAIYGGIKTSIGAALGYFDQGDPTTGRTSPQFQRNGFLQQIWPQLPGRIASAVAGVPGMEGYAQALAANPSLATDPTGAMALASDLAQGNGVNLGAIISKRDPTLANHLKTLEGLPARIRGLINNEGYKNANLAESEPEWNAILQGLSGNAGQENFFAGGIDQINQSAELTNFADVAGVRKSSKIPMSPSLERNAGLSNEWAAMGASVFAEQSTTGVIGGIQGKYGNARIAQLEKLKRYQSHGAQIGLREDIAGVRSSIGENIGTIQGQEYGWGPLGHPPTTFDEAANVANWATGAISDVAEQKPYMQLPGLFQKQALLAQQYQRAGMGEQQRVEQGTETPAQREASGRYADHMQKVIALEKDYSDVLDKHASSSGAAVKAQHALTEELVKWSKGVEGATSQIKVVTEGLPGGGAGVTGASAYGAAQTRLAQLHGMTPAQRQAVGGVEEEARLTEAARGYEAAPGQEKMAEEQAAEQKGGASWARRLLGGFGLMYLRSISGIILGSTNMGYQQTQQDRIAAAQAMGSQMGGVEASVPQAEQVRRAQAAYGGGGYELLQSAYINSLKTQPALTHIAESAVGGMAAYGLASYTLPMFGVGAAAVGPIAAGIGAMTFLASGALSAVGAMNQKDNVAIQGALAMQNAGSWAEYQAARPRLDQLNAKPGFSLGQLFGGAPSGGGNLANFVTAGASANIAGWAISPAAQRQTEILSKLYQSKTPEQRAQVLKTFKVSQAEEGQLMGYLGRMREQVYTQIPLEGILGATALEGAYNYPFKDFGQVATSLSQGRPIEQTALSVQQASGYTPAMIYGGQGIPANNAQWIERLSGLSTPQLSLLQSGAQFAGGLGQNINYWQSSGLGMNQAQERLNKFGAVSGTPAGDLYTQAMQIYYNKRQLGQEAGPEPRIEDFTQNITTGPIKRPVPGMLNLAPGALGPIQTQPYNITIPNQYSPEQYGLRSLENQNQLAMQQATGNVAGILNQYYGMTPEQAQAASGTYKDLGQQSAYYQRLQSGQQTVQGLQGLGINNAGLQAFQKAVPTMGAGELQRWQAAFNLEPMALTQIAQAMPSQMWQQIAGQTLQGYGGKVPSEYMFMADINMQGNVTGNPWGTSSGQLGQTKPFEMANRIWGNDWNKNPRLNQGAINAWQGIQAPWNDQQGNPVMLGGQQGMQYYQANLQYENQMATLGNQQQQLQLSKAFTTGVGIQQYAGIKNPQTGQPFGFNTGQFSWNVPGIGGFTSTGGGQWGLEDTNRTLGYAQQEYGFTTQQKQIDLQNRQFQQNQALSRKQAVQQRGWSQQDWAYQDTTRNEQWQWTQEDFAESSRFMTGRDRRLAERNLRRQTTVHDQETDQIDKTRDRQKILWADEDTRFTLQNKQQKESLVLQQEMLTKSQEFYIERKKLEQESIDLQRAMWTEQTKLQEQAIGIQAAYAKQSLDLQLTMLALDTWTTNVNGSMKTLNTEAMKPFLDNLTTLYPEMKSWVDMMKAAIGVSDTSTPGMGGDTSGDKVVTPPGTIPAMPTTPPGPGMKWFYNGTDWTQVPINTPDPIKPNSIEPTIKKTATSSASSYLSAWNRTIVASPDTQTPQLLHVTVMVGNEVLKEYIVNTVDQDIKL